MKKALATLSNMTEILIKLAGTLFQEINTEDSIIESKELLLRAISIEADNADAYLMLGRIHYQLEEWDQAS